MAQQITDADIRRKVTKAIELDGPEPAQGIDIDGVVREIVDTYGLIDIDGCDSVTGSALLPDDVFWAIVNKHDSTQTPDQVVATLTLAGLTVRVTLTATEHGPRLDLHPQNCRTECDQPGSYLLTATAEATAD